MGVHGTYCTTELNGKTWRKPRPFFHLERGAVFGLSSPATDLRHLDSSRPLRPPPPSYAHTSSLRTNTIGECVQTAMNTVKSGYQRRTAENSDPLFRLINRTSIIPPPRGISLLGLLHVSQPECPGYWPLAATSVLAL